jgi:hypothetical protein
MQLVGNTCWDKIDLLHGFGAGYSKQTLRWRRVKRTSIICSFSENSCYYIQGYWPHHSAVKFEHIFMWKMKFRILYCAHTMMGVTVLQLCFFSRHLCSVAMGKLSLDPFFLSKRAIQSSWILIFNIVLRTLLRKDGLEFLMCN